jgi:hypothetical protein
VSEVEGLSTNMVHEMDPLYVMNHISVEGVWNLFDTSSSAFKLNTGLWALSGFVAMGIVCGSMQRMKSIKYTSDMEYIEKIVTTTPSSASFEASITGRLEFAGKYRYIDFYWGAITRTDCRARHGMNGMTSMKADHWKA